MLPESPAKRMMRVWPQAVIPGAQWPGFPIRTLVSKRASGQMRRFRRSAAADQAGQAANPGEISVVARSPCVLGFADHAFNSACSFPGQPQLLRQVHAGND